MSQLVAMLFDDPYKAEDARTQLHRMGNKGLLDIDETAIIVKSMEGAIRVSQDANVLNEQQKVCQLIGLVIGAVTGTFPFIFSPAIAGRLVGRLTDYGITNEFIRDVRSGLNPDTSCLILFGRSDETRRKKALARLAILEPRVVQIDLQPQVEQELNSALAEEEVRSARA
jgi:uncharacterized membrane protein